MKRRFEWIPIPSCNLFHDKCLLYARVARFRFIRRYILDLKGPFRVVSRIIRSSSVNVEPLYLAKKYKFSRRPPFLSNVYGGDGIEDIRCFARRGAINFSEARPRFFFFSLSSFGNVVVGYLKFQRARSCLYVFVHKYPFKHKPVHSITKLNIILFCRGQ